MFRSVITLALFAAALGCSSSTRPSDDGTPTGDVATDAVATEDSGAGDSGNDPSGDTPIDTAEDTSDGGAGQTTIRIATYNTSLFRDSAGALVDELDGGLSLHARQIARLVQRTQPDILLVNELDHDAENRSAELLNTSYFDVSQDGDDPMGFVAYFAPPSNTGVHSGFDFDNNGAVAATPGSIDYGGDAFGFGTYEGQYAFAVYSRFPILTEQIRCFQNLTWASMPDALLPDDPDTPEDADWYSEEELAVFRLSSKNHCDVPIDVNGETVHFLVSHPTPPAFDGPEDRNGRRNHDEIRLWLDYVSTPDAAYLVDDSGDTGGLPAGAHFVVAGDLNADPEDGSGEQGAIRDLLASELTIDPMPMSAGGAEAAERDGQANASHSGDPALDTADFSDGSVGNLRVDYVIPSSTLELVDAGVFWPTADSPDAALVQVTDHRMVWIDVLLP